MELEPVLRLGEAQDAARIAQLVLFSDSGLLPALFGPSAERTLVRLASGRNNPFSFEHVLTVACGEKIVGVALGVKQRAIAAERLPTAAQVLRIYGLAAPRQFARLARASRALRDLGPADFYLSNIAVDPEYRSSGLGGWLLGTLEDRLAREGILRIALDCDPENTNALRFYYRHGYEESGTHEISLRSLLPAGERRERFAFRRMLKRL